MPIKFVWRNWRQNTKNEREAKKVIENWKCLFFLSTKVFSLLASCWLYWGVVKVSKLDVKRCLTLTHSHTLSHSLSHIHSYTHTHTVSLSHSFTQPLSHTHSFTLNLTLSHSFFSLFLSFPLSLTHTYKHTRSRTHTHIFLPFSLSLTTSSYN